MIFLTLLIIPLIIIIIGSQFTKKICWRELIMMIGAQIIIAGISCVIVSCQNTQDVEVINGEVLSKTSKHVSCSHSYRCFCHQSCSGTGKNRSCHEVCQTCYRHSYDVSWYVRSNIETITISRIDSQGLKEPPRWSRVKIGEPYATLQNYENYVKASPDTLFRHQGSLEKYKNSIPNYPDRVYDYYHINRLIEVGTNVSNKSKWNAEISEINKRIGPKKQANFVLVFTNKPHDYFYALQQAWIGGKKNDIIVVIGLEHNNNKPKWVEVMAWAKNKDIYVNLRDDILELTTITPETLLPTVEADIMKYFIRKPMHDFEYLASIITPTTTQWIVSIIIGLIVAIGQLFYYHHVDIFGDR